MNPWPTFYALTIAFTLWLSGYYEGRIIEKERITSAQEIAVREADWLTTIEMANK